MLGTEPKTSAREVTAINHKLSPATPSTFLLQNTTHASTVLFPKYVSEHFNTVFLVSYLRSLQQTDILGKKIVLKLLVSPSTECTTYICIVQSLKELEIITVFK